MTLPRLYAPTRIKFWSLRSGLGSNYGVIFDIDTEVERLCRRVRTTDGWKWQIVNFSDIEEWDYSIYADKEILDVYGSELEFEYVTQAPIAKR